MDAALGSARRSGMYVDFAGLIASEENEGTMSRLREQDPGARQQNYQMGNGRAETRNLIVYISYAKPPQLRYLQLHTALCISVANPWRCREIAGARAQ